MATTYDLTPANPFNNSDLNYLVRVATDEARAACKNMYHNRARVKALKELAEALEENVNREDLEYFLLTRKGTRSENWAYHLQEFFKKEDLKKYCVENQFTKLPK